MTERPDWVKRRLNGRAGMRPSPFWVPVEGDWICGEVVELGRVPSRFGDPKPVMTIRVEAGTQRGAAVEPCSWATIALSHTWLARWVDREDPHVGEKVAIEYAGRVHSPSGSYRHEYVCGVERPDGHVIEDGEPRRW